MSNQEDNTITHNTDNAELKEEESSAMSAESSVANTGTSSSAATAENTEKTKSKSFLKDDESQVEICRNFLQNRCTRGSFCKFRHCKPNSSERKRSRSPISNKPEKSSDICRDFLNNMCDRGMNCRYFHPPEDEIDKKPWFTLCYDFQNGKCIRHDCRFFHVSPEDEESFRVTGEVPFHILEQATNRGIILEEKGKGSKPICKDHLNGFCKTTPCRFRHVNRREYENKVYRTIRKELTALAGCDASRREKFMGFSGPERYEPPPLFGRNNDFGNRMHSAPYEDMSHGRPSPYNYFESGGAPGSYSQQYGNDEYESLQQQLRQAEDYLVQVQQEKDQRITALERQLSGFRGNGSYSGAMQPDMDRLRRKNEELMRDLAAKQSWEVIYNDTKAKLDDAMIENKQMSSQLSSLNSKLATMTSDLKSWEEFEAFVKNQLYRSQDKMREIEAELSRPYAINGSSIILSQRDSWRQLQTILSQILKLSSREMDGHGYNSNFGGNNVGTPYNNF